MTLLRKMSCAVLLALPAGELLAHVGSHSGAGVSHFFGEPVHNGVWILAGCLILTALMWKRRRRHGG